MPNVVSPFRVLLKSRCLISRNTVSSLRDTGPSFPLNAFMRVIVQHHITTNTPCLRFASVNLDGPVWWTGWTIIVYMLLLMLARLFSNKMATVQHELKESLSQSVQAIIDGLHDAIIDDGDCRDYFCAQIDRILHLVARATILWDVPAATAEGIESSLRRAMNLLMSQDKDDSAANAMFLCSGNRGRPSAYIPIQQLQLYLDYGFSLSMIGQMFGVSSKTVQRRIAQFNLKRTAFAELSDMELDNEM